MPTTRECSIWGNGEKFIHKKDNYILSSGKTGLFYCHAEVQIYIADAYGNQVTKERDSSSYQGISCQLLIHPHSLHSDNGACAHMHFFYAASTTCFVYLYFVCFVIVVVWFLVSKIYKALSQCGSSLYL